MAVTTAIAAVAAASYGVYSGEQQKSAQKAAVRRQADAQKQAQALSVAQARKADQETMAANRKTPDIGSLLAFEQGFPGFGAGSRTGAGAVDPSRLNLKRPVTTLGAP